MNTPTMPDSALLSRFVAHITGTDIALFALSIFALTLLEHGIKTAAASFAKKHPKKRMGLLAWVPVLNFIIYFAGLFTSFYFIFHPSKQLLMGFAVSSFVALGFALRNSAASIMAGVALLTDKPFQVGDRVTFQDHYGEIVDIGLRSVKLMTLDESIVTIPNQRFMTDVVKSNSAGELKMMVVVDVFVPVDADLYATKAILEHQCGHISYVDTTKKISVTAKEILTETGIVSVRMTTSCVLKDARFERAFQTEFLMGVNQLLRQQKLS